MADNRVFALRAAAAYGTMVDWGVEDLVAAAILIGAGGLGLWLAGRWFAGWRFWVAAVAVTAAVAIVWADLAVGLFR